MNVLEFRGRLIEEFTRLNKLADETNTELLPTAYANVVVHMLANLNSQDVDGPSS